MDYKQYSCRYTFIKKVTGFKMFYFIEKNSYISELQQYAIYLSCKSSFLY